MRQRLTAIVMVACAGLLSAWGNQQDAGQSVPKNAVASDTEVDAGPPTTGGGEAATLDEWRQQGWKNFATVNQNLMRANNSLGSGSSPSPACTSLGEAATAAMADPRPPDAILASDLSAELGAPNLAAKACTSGDTATASAQLETATSALQRAAERLRVLGVIPG